MSNIRFFRSFIEVAKHGSFTAAAEHISLTPAAVGLQIKALEDYLGYTVFDRTSKSITLNARGHQLVPLAMKVLEVCDSMKAQDFSQTGISGRLNVASIATAMAFVVRSTLEIRKKHPHLMIKPGISYSNYLTRQVKEGQLDAAVSIKSAPNPPPGVLWTSLYHEPLVFIARRGQDNDLSVRELLSKRLFLRVSINSITGVLIDKLIRQQKLKLGEQLEMNAMRTIVDLVKDGLGVTILPQFPGAEWHKNKELRIEQFNSPAAFRNVGLFENEGRSHLTSTLRHQLVKSTASLRPS